MKKPNEYEIEEEKCKVQEESKILQEYKSPIFYKYVFYFLGRSLIDNYYLQPRRFVKKSWKLLTKADNMLKVNILLNSNSCGAWYIYAKCMFDQMIHY